MDKNFETQVMEYGGLTTITVDTYAAITDEDGNYIDSKEQKLNDALVDQIRTIDHVRVVTPVIQKNAVLYCGKFMSWIYITAMDYEVYDDFDFPKLQFGEYPNEKDNSAIIFGSDSPYEFYDPTSRGGATKQVDLQRDKVILKFEDYPVNERKKAFTLPLKNIAKMEKSNGEFDWSTYMDIDYFKSIYVKYCNTLSLEDRKKAIKTIEEYQQIRLNVDNIDNVEYVQDRIQELGFQSFSMMQYLQPIRDSSKSMQMVLGFLGFIVLAVSALSIANTMVMSIYERTKEIGVMKVLGCVVTDIRKLFLLEASLIGLIGGVLGIILGYIASWALNKFAIIGSLVSGGFMPNSANTTVTVIPFYLPIVSLLISVGVGLLSGYFPARRATKISAIEAMKTEG
jgi:hypothetical protein